MTGVTRSHERIPAHRTPPYSGGGVCPAFGLMHGLMHGLHGKPLKSPDSPCFCPPGSHFSCTDAPNIPKKSVPSSRPQSSTAQKRDTPDPRSVHVRVSVPPIRDPLPAPRPPAIQQRKPQASARNHLHFAPGDPP
jgi:hypothetical protein